MRLSPRWSGHRVVFLSRCATVLTLPIPCSRYRNALFELQEKPDSLGMSKRVFITQNPPCDPGRAPKDPNLETPAPAIFLTKSGSRGFQEPSRKSHAALRDL